MVSDHSVGRASRRAGLDQCRHTPHFSVCGSPLSPGMSAIPGVIPTSRVMGPVLARMTAGRLDVSATARACLLQPLSSGPHLPTCPGALHGAVNEAAGSVTSKKGHVQIATGWGRNARQKTEATHSHRTRAPAGRPPRLHFAAPKCGARICALAPHARARGGRAGAHKRTRSLKSA
jgi:hypothetical protein